MRVALIGAELEENLGLRYMASALEHRGHESEIVAFNSGGDVQPVVQRVLALQPDIVGLSMVFTGRAREFCRLAEELRAQRYGGHLVAGGHFACLNSIRLLKDFPAFDSVALGEGEQLIVDLAGHLDAPENVTGLCFRDRAGGIRTNPSLGNPSNLDARSSSSGSSLWCPCSGCSASGRSRRRSSAPSRATARPRPR